MEFTVKDFSDWQKLANEVQQHLKNPILLLKGNLGAGKTTFTKYFLEKLGIQEEVSSPTYSIVNEYDTVDGKIYHFDLYRLKSFAEAEDIGIYEYLENGRLCIIEWPEILEEILTEYPHHTLCIENLGDERQINFL